MVDSEARNCCFDGAQLKNMDFQNSDLSGSSFQKANCDGATFLGTNLTGCDFRGAILTGAQFQNAIIDKTTDLRGASLINASSDTRHSNNGNLFAKGVDLRAATHDATTLFGSDPLAYEIKIAEQASKLARNEYGADGAVISALLKVAATQIREGKVDTWEADLLAQLTAPQQELYQEILDEVFHRRLV